MKKHKKKRRVLRVGDGGEENYRLRLEIKRLKRALKKYYWHLCFCGWDITKCSCGLREQLGRW